VTAGGLATFGTGGGAGFIGWPVMAHGLDQFMTGVGKVLTGRPRETVTEQVLQQAGMPREWAAATNNGLSISGLMGAIGVARNAMQVGQIAALNTTRRGLIRDVGKYAESPVGRSGWELKYPKYQDTTRHASTSIQNRLYSGHALDQMQNRGLLPSVVENTIKNGQTFTTKTGTIGYYDSVNNARVIVNYKTGRVVTIIPGPPK